MQRLNLVIDLIATAITKLPEQGRNLFNSWATTSLSGMILGISFIIRQCIICNVQQLWKKKYVFTVNKFKHDIIPQDRKQETHSLITYTNSDAFLDSRYTQIAILLNQQSSKEPDFQFSARFFSIKQIISDMLIEKSQFDTYLLYWCRQYTTNTKA